jgi:hypothetical protein
MTRTLERYSSGGRCTYVAFEHMQLYPTSLHLPWLDVDEEKSVTGDKTVVC